MASGLEGRAALACSVASSEAELIPMLWRRDCPASTASSNRFASLPVNDFSARVSPRRVSCTRTSSRIRRSPLPGSAVYEPRTTRSAPGLILRRSKVAFARLSSSASGSSRLTRATSSPGSIRSAPSEASSVLSISEKAGDNQLSSGWPGRLRKPRTATERRIRGGVSAPTDTTLPAARGGRVRNT